VVFLFTAPLGDLIYDIFSALFTGSQSPAQTIAKFLKAYWPLTLAVVGAIVLMAFCGLRHLRHRQREEDQARKRRERAARVRQGWIQLHQTFELFTPAPMLSPKDLGFQFLIPGRPGEYAIPLYRPLYPFYIPRRAVPYNHLPNDPLHLLYDEQALIQRLQAGGRVLFVGPPLEGKSRVVYHILTQMRGFQILKPSLEKVPSDDDFAILRGRQVVLLLEDLNTYIDSALDLGAFCAKLSQSGATVWAILATCRDGPELAKVHEKGLQSPLRRFYEQMFPEDLTLRFLPPTADEKAQLARGIGKAWSVAQSPSFPTLGSITMKEYMEAMRLRFQEDLDPQHRAVLMALKLLDCGGVPATHPRLNAVLSHIFSSSPSPLWACLDTLAAYAFLRRPAHQDPLQPEPAYLRDAVAYLGGKPPADDLPRLRCVLIALADAEGLFALGNTYVVSLENYPSALEVYEQALQLRPDDPDSWHNKGVALGELGQYQEALAAFEQASQLRPDDPATWYNKGVALVKLGQNQKALAAFEQASRLRPNHPDSWHNKGVALVKLGQNQKALAAFEQASRLRPNHPATWYNKGLVLVTLGQNQKALAAFEQASQLRPDDPATWYNKGLVLVTLGQYQEALAAFKQASQLRPDDPATWLWHKGLVLVTLGQYQEALAAFEQASQLRPDFYSPQSRFA
jgi:tetratricopeptide (TPR) repeat protein